MRQNAQCIPSGPWRGRAGIPFIHFAVTCTERDHVARSRGGMLIMLSEEDGRMLSLSLRWLQGTQALSRRELDCRRPLESSACCFFLTDPWEEESVCVGWLCKGGVALWKESYPRAQRGKSDWAQSQRGIPPRVSSACRGVLHVLQWRRSVCNNSALKFALLVRLFSIVARWRQGIDRICKLVTARGPIQLLRRFNVGSRHQRRVSE